MSIFNLFKRKPKISKENNYSNQSIGRQRNKDFNTYGISDRDFIIDAPFTADFISEVGKKEVFVFGSNLAGHHAGGAAKVASDRFGAIWGQGEGLQGNSYAIPTMQGGIDTIRPYVDKFIEFATCHPELIFYVTRIGCGIAGFKEEEIAPLFCKAINIPNIRLPKEFHDIINAQLFAEQACDYWEKMKHNRWEDFSDDEQKKLVHACMIIADDVGVVTTEEEQKQYLKDQLPIYEPNVGLSYKI